MHTITINKTNKVIKISSIKECLSNRKTNNSLCINNEYILKKNDLIHFYCSCCGKEIIQHFRFKEKFFREEILCDKCQMKETNLERFGVENPYQSKEIQEKIKKTNLERYGVESVLKNDEIKNRVKKTQFERYGRYGFNTEKQKETLEERYGDRDIFKTKYFIKKSKDTKREKYGDVNYNNKEKRSLSVLEKYGKDWYVQTKEFSEKAYGTKVLNGTLFRSNHEIEIENFLKELDITVIINDKNMIYPNELDIYLPDYNLAIEINGLYWHSNLFKDKNYHLNKTLECEKKGIQLIHIFEDEWISKKEIVKNRIKYKLGFYDFKIGARETEITEISSKVKNEFLEKHHIQGKDFSKVKLGAFYKNNLVGVMTFSSLRKNMGYKNKNNKEYELSRFVTSGQIVGLANKMLKYFIKNYDWERIVSYADKRWNNGNVYEKIGFSKLNDTKPNYWYVLGNKRIYRYAFRKSQLKDLKNYSEDKTEQQIMEENNIYRIYDCGHYKFELRNDLCQ